MRAGIRIGVAFTLAGLVAVAAPLLAQGGEPAAGPKVEGLVLRQTAQGQEASFVIHLADQADLRAAYGIENEDARGRFVYQTLRAHAERTQAPVRALLKAHGVPYTPFWAANVVVTRGDRGLVEELASRADVKVIEANASAKWLQADAARSLAGPLAVEPGVAKVRAPEVWALGYTGAGIVVGNQDTGVRWTHNALRGHYRGWNGATADHNYNWHDAVHSGGGSCGPNTTQPCDDNGHGSHTTGTAVGDDGLGNQVGVAPGANWIGCRNMNVGVGTPATYTECFQFFLAPTDLNGRNANPSRRPHVMNNSWGCPPSEGCAPDTLRQVVQNSEASGIFVVASAGNGGPNCSTVQDPPAIYASSFTTAAINSATNTVPTFSSRGPVTVDGSGRIKPDIAAPGVGVRSAHHASDTAFVSFGGTSMAGPHVAGVVALLWSAHPGLVRNIAATKARLTSTANAGLTTVNPAECGGVGSRPNNHFGWGLVDAFAAHSVQPPPPPPRARCRVPKVIGLKLVRARTVIRSRRCRVGRVRYRRVARKARRGRVIAQSPRARVLRPANTRVHLVLGRR